MQAGSRVKIKDTDILATVISIGKRGLMLLASPSFGAFSRTVYSSAEVMEVIENE